MNRGNSFTNTGKKINVAHNVSMRLRNEQYSGAYAGECLGSEVIPFTPERFAGIQRRRRSRRAGPEISVISAA
jgi:hypothetical protein